MVRTGLTVDPVTGTQDGSYVLVEADDYTLEETTALVDGLSGLLEARRELIPPAES